MSPRRRGRRDRVCPPLSSPSLKPASPFETLIVVNMTVAGPSSHSEQVASPPRDASSITQLSEDSWDELLHGLKRGEIEQLFPVVPNPDLINHEHPEEMEQKSAREEKFAAHFGRSLLRQRILFSRLRASLPMSFLTNLCSHSADRGVRQEINLVPDSNNCVTRQCRSLVTKSRLLTPPF